MRITLHTETETLFIISPSSSATGHHRHSCGTKDTLEYEPIIPVAGLAVNEKAW
jgi:hypothetical protein